MDSRLRTGVEGSTDLSYRDSVKVNLETLTRCGGSCMGCLLEESERRDGRLWSQDRFACLSPFISGFIEHHLAIFDPVEVSINCGQGDHLLVEPHDLANLVRWMSSVGAGRAIGFLTASAVGKHDRVRRAVDSIRETSLQIGQPVMLDLVFDPAKTRVSKFSDTYALNLEYIREAFGGVDLAINIGPDTVESLPPKALHAFLVDADVRRFTVNLTPTHLSRARFAGRFAAIFDWARDLLALWSINKGYEINLAQVAGTALLFSKGADAADPLLAHQILRQSAARSIYIDDTNMIWHSQEGFGDIAFSRRLGWQAHASIPQDKQSAGAVVERSADRFALEVSRAFLASAPCRACRHNQTCPRLGGAQLMRVGAGEGSDCPTGLRPILDHVADRVDLAELATLKTHTHLPAGFADGAVPHARTIGREQARMDFGALGVAR